MATKIIMPKLGMIMEEGTVVEWLKQDGEKVEKGKPLVVVESQKITYEVEAPSSGIVRILARSRETRPIGGVIGFILTPGESMPEIAEVSQPAVKTTSQAIVEKPAQAIAEKEKISHVVLSSPAARTLARRLKVDISKVRGTGPGGRIVEKDVKKFYSEKLHSKKTPMATKANETLNVHIKTNKTPLKVAATNLVPLTGARRTIAERMVVSAQTTVRVTLITDVDATRLAETKKRLKASVADNWGFAPDYNDLLGMIVARKLREFPYMNIRLSTDGNSIEMMSVVNLGIAVETEHGLLVPVIRDADQKSLLEFGIELRALADRARSSKLLPDDLIGGTFTITNLGMYEVEAFTPIIRLPEAAILGIGRIQPKAVVLDGQIVMRHMLTLSLVFDHRLVDGAPAARFLQQIKRSIENPYLLLR